MKDTHHLLSPLPIYQQFTSVHGKGYSIQHKFVSGFLLVLQFPLPIIDDLTEILLKVALNTMNPPKNIFGIHKFSLHPYKM
jgi:hypothetical protein